MNCHNNYSRYTSIFCRHNNDSNNCDKCKDEDDMDIDKCLNCGKYKASSQLNQDQCCIKGCRNPNEY